MIFLWVSFGQDYTPHHLVMPNRGKVERTKPRNHVLGGAEEEEEEVGKKIDIIAEHDLNLADP